MTSEAKLQKKAEEQKIMLELVKNPVVESAVWTLFVGYLFKLDRENAGGGLGGLFNNILSGFTQDVIWAGGMAAITAQQLGGMNLTQLIPSIAKVLK